MKRLLIFLLIALLVLSPRLYWSLKDSKSLSVAVVDMTVPKKDYREHNGLFQVLDYEKVVKPSGELYDIGKDYFGFDPYDKVPGASYSAESTPDLIYITDTYGVFADDLKEEPEGEHSELVDGGMGLLEWNAIMASKTERTTLIGEFNAFASPTDPSVSRVMQKNLNVRWDGWIGRYFPDFTSDEIPAWLKDSYEKQQGREWAFDEDGLAFVHTDGRVVILDDHDSEDGVQFDLTDAGALQFPSVKSAPYLYWFDIVNPVNGAIVLAEYSIGLTDDGERKLEEAGIPETFPAVIHQPAEKTYYFAGDYADYEKRAFVKWQGFPVLYKYFAVNLSEFYWKSYFPMLSQIIRDIQTGKAG